MVHIRENLPWPLEGQYWWNASTYFKKMGTPSSEFWCLKAECVKSDSVDYYIAECTIAFSESREELLMLADLNGIPLKEGIDGEPRS